MSGTRGPLSREAAAGLPARLPDPPPSWDAETAEDYRDFSASDLAALVTVEAIPALMRLFGYRSALLSAMRAGDTMAARRYEASIVPLEDRFGLTPVARRRLGVPDEPPHNDLDDFIRP